MMTNPPISPALTDEPQIAFWAGNVRVNNHTTLDDLIIRGWSSKDAQECLKFRDFRLHILKGLPWN